MDSSLAASSLLVVLNPAANRGKALHYRELARKKAAEEGAEYIETSRAGEAEERARQAANEGSAVIVVGGDGSIHEVVNGLLAAEKRVPLGIVAAGSGNDFAWNTLHLPHDPVEAFERAFHGALINIDAGRVNGRYFANAFSIGLDADIAVTAHRLKRWPFMSGQRLYYSATLKQLLFGYHRCPQLAFRLDECEWMELRRYVLLAVSNGPTYGGGFRINPPADPTDGWLRVCAIDYMPLLRALRLLPVVQRGEHTGLPGVRFFQAQRIEIRSRSLVNIQLDGETMCAHVCQAEVLPGALYVRV
jgi:diacylglycerol kinase (ATP)